MDSSDGNITRVLNLVFILDSTENVSDNDYKAACEFLDSFKDEMIVDGMDTDVRIVIASTSGEISEPVPISEFKFDGSVRPKQDPSVMLRGLIEVLRKIEHLGATHVVDNAIIYLSNGKFIAENQRAYIDITRNWRYTRTPKLIVNFDETANKHVLADIVGSKGRVFGRDIFDDIKIYVLEGGIEFHKIHEVAEIPTVYAEEQEYKVDRRAEEDEAPVEDVYDM